MEPGRALSTAAQIAVALAGFAGVVNSPRLVPVYANHSHATRDRRADSNLTAEPAAALQLI